MKITKNSVEIRMGSSSNACPLEGRYEFTDADGVTVELDAAIMYHLMLVLCDDHQRILKSRPSLKKILQLLGKQRENELVKRHAEKILGGYV